MQQANSTLTPTQIFNALRHSALPIGSSPNFLSGYGFIQADAALPLVPPGAPLLSLGSTTVSVGQSTTISWSSNNAVSCTASGGWSGTLHNTGSQTLTPTATGSKTYTLTCTNPAGTSQAASVTLTAVAPPSPPTLALSSATIGLGSSTTISWSSTGTDELYGLGQLERYARDQRFKDADAGLRGHHHLLADLLEWRCQILRRERDPDD